MNSSRYFAFTGLLLMGCAHTESLTSTETEKGNYEAGTRLLEIQKPVPVGALTLNLQKVEDSRCPLNANCIRAGSAVTQIQLQDTQGNSVTKTLYLGEALPAPDNRGMRTADTVHVSLANKAYRLILMEVLPFPNASDPSPAAKTAKVSVVAL